MQSVVDASEANGFAVAVKRSFKKDEDGNPQRYDLECVRGERKKSQHTEQRTPTVTRENCPWSAYLRYYKTMQCWRFVMRIDHHSHFVVTDPGQFAISRRRKYGEFREEIDTMLEGPIKRTSTQAARDVVNAHPGVIMRTQDVENMRYQKHLTRLGGRTDTQQLIYHLQNDPHTRYVKAHQGGGDDGPILHMLWTNDWCISKWQENPEVLAFDNTYKTISTICLCSRSLELPVCLPLSAYHGLCWATKLKSHSNGLSLR